MRLALFSALAALSACLLLLCAPAPGRLGAPSVLSPASGPSLPSTVPPPWVRDGFLGVVLPQESVEIVAPFEARLERIGAQMGAHVQAGTELARLDLEPLRLQETLTRATLAGAEAQEQEATLALQAAQERLQRYLKPTPGTFSEEELATARYEERTVATHLLAAHARTQERQAALAQIRLQLEQGSLRAPFEGFVTARYLDPGARVHAGVSVLRLIRAGQLRVRFALPDMLADTFTIGDAVSVLLPEKGQRLAGRVVAVSPEVDTASRMVFALAQLEASRPGEARVSTGMEARVSRLTSGTLSPSSSGAPAATSRGE